jgi:hypothetical protein
MSDDDEVRGPLNTHATAGYLVSFLERRGAVFTVNAEGKWFCDLNPSDVASHEEAEEISGAILGLRDEIRAVLLARRGIH